MAGRTISDSAALFVLEQWYSKPEDEQVRFRAFCFQAGLFDNDFKYVNNIKRVADCHTEPMKYIQRQLSVIAESEAEDEGSQEQEQSQQQSEGTADDEAEVEEETQDQEPEVVDKYEERLDVVVVRQGFTNMLLILLILVTSPYLAYNLAHIYNAYFRTYDIIYLLETPDVIYL
jgi:uncharacterized membrane protein YdbT with pleckstrin-like domain